jgi:hypothetical protein
VSEIDIGLLERYPEFVAWRCQIKTDEAVEEPRTPENPEELISAANWHKILIFIA